MEQREEWIREDAERSLENDVRTMKEVRNMVNSIEEDIQMEGIAARECEGEKLPMLDYQAWTEIQEVGGVKSTKLRWEFYEKPMINRKMMMADTALPERMKTTVLLQEIIRRERNSARNMDREIRVRIRNRMMMKMKLSGYKLEQRVNIFLSGLRGYKKI